MGKEGQEETSRNTMSTMGNGLPSEVLEGGELNFAYVDLSDLALVWVGTPHPILCDTQGVPLSSLSQFEKKVAFEDKRVFQLFLKQFRKQEALTQVLRLHHPDSDKRFWFRLTIVPLKQESSKRVGLLITPLHDLHVLYEQDLESRRMASLEHLAAGISHEFNNHLTPIRGFVEMALDQLNHDQEEVVQELSTALECVDYIAELVEQIRSYGRKSFLTPKPLEVNRTLMASARVALNIYNDQQKEIDLIERLDNRLPRLWLDHARFQEAITHIVKNAIDAIPRRGNIILEAETISIGHHQPEPAQEGEGDFVKISIVDNGMGIETKHLAHVYDPFFTTHNRAKAKGLGLSIVQGMVSQHGGWIEIHSVAGHGTEVYLYFPVREEEQIKPVQELPPAEVTMDVMPAADWGRMLIADDEKFVRQLITTVFAKEGWVIDEVANHHELLEKIKLNPHYYSIILLDYTLLRGLPETLFSLLEQQRSKTKLMLLSGVPEDETIVSLCSKGCTFISKPFSTTEIIVAVDELMTREVSS